VKLKLRLLHRPTRSGVADLPEGREEEAVLADLFTLTYAERTPTHAAINREFYGVGRRFLQRSSRKRNVNDGETFLQRPARHTGVFPGGRFIDIIKTLQHRQAYGGNCSILRTARQSVEIESSNR
jgi:hypothetical protein